MFDRRDDLAVSPAHQLALDCLAAGIEAGRPGRAVDRHCSVEGDALFVREATYDLASFDDVLVLGGGKAADGLAAALEDLLGDRLSGGLVVTDVPTADTEAVTVRTGEHPEPGQGSVANGEAVLERAAVADERTLVLAAITGGGSALLCSPAEGLSVEALREVTRALLDAGAPIDEINAVRRACSRLKGGGLASAGAPATVVGLLVSDVVGDDPAVVASGPTVPVETDPDAALAVLDRYDVSVETVREHLENADPKPAGSPPVDNHVIASGRDAVDAASDVAADRGYEPCVLSTRLAGEAREAGRFHAAVAREVGESGRPVEPPAVLLSGGETTVTVTGDGVGGPNLEFALAAARDLPDGAVLGAVDTDGSDGATDAAGALVDADTRSDRDADADVGLGRDADDSPGRDADAYPERDADDASRALARNDSYPFLAERDALLGTGPTGTNVDDLRVLVVRRPVGF